MKDQYDEEVPNDLVTMPCITHLDDADIKLVANATWYDVLVDMGDNEEVEILCVSAKAIDYLSEDDLCGEPKEILRVNDVLKRWSEEDNFYHA